MKNIKTLLIIFLIPISLFANNDQFNFATDQVKLKRYLKISFNFENYTPFVNFQMQFSRNFTPESISFYKKNGESISLKLGYTTHVENISTAVHRINYQNIVLTENEIAFFKSSEIKTCKFSNNKKIIKLKTKSIVQLNLSATEFWGKAKPLIEKHLETIELERKRVLAEERAKETRRLFVRDSTMNAEKNSKRIRDSILIVEHEVHMNSYSIDCENDPLIGVKICGVRNKFLSQGKFRTGNLRIHVSKIKNSYFLEFDPNGKICVNSKAQVIVVFEDGERIVLKHRGEVDCGIGTSISILLTKKHRSSFKSKKITDIMVLGSLGKGGIYRKEQINNNFLGKLLRELETI